MAKELDYKGRVMLLEVAEYANGGLAVVMWEKEYESEVGTDWCPYADITRWLAPVPERMAFVDENNLPGIGKWLEDNGLAVDTGYVQQSGYCLYPLYEFTDRFYEVATDE